MLEAVRNAALLPSFVVGIAVAVAWLRWIMLTQWTCRSCHSPHLHCECKPAWVKKLL